MCSLYHYTRDRRISIFSCLFAVVGGVSEDEWRVRRLVCRLADRRLAAGRRSSSGSGFRREWPAGGRTRRRGYERTEWHKAWHADPPPDLLDGIAPELHREPRSAEVPDSYLEIRERRREELAERHRQELREQLQAGARY